MRTATEVAMRQQDALEVILGVLGRHDPETLERIETDFAQRGTMKWSARGGRVTPQDEHLLILAEAVASLAKRVDEFAEANKPRPRGRPRKQEASS
jgi:hypothetical protein